MYKSSLMKVLNHTVKFIQRQVYVFEGKVNIDVQYFIQKIEEGIEKENNLSYKTNVMSKMTSFDYFLKDDKFLKFAEEISPAFEYHNNNVRVKLEDAWGNKLLPGDCVKPHNHGNVEISGVLYLEDKGEKLYFSQLDVKIKPEKGKFVLFDSTLLHGVPTNSSKKPRYSIAFNFRQTGFI